MGVLKGVSFSRVGGREGSRHPLPLLPSELLGSFSLGQPALARELTLGLPRRSRRHACSFKRESLRPFPLPLASRSFSQHNPVQRNKFPSENCQCTKMKIEQRISQRRSWEHREHWRERAYHPRGQATGGRERVEGLHAERSARRRRRIRSVDSGDERWRTRTPRTSR